MPGRPGRFPSRSFGQPTTVPQAGTVVFDDLASGTVTLAGNASDSRTATDARSGAVGVSGAAVEAVVRSGTASGVVTVAGTRTDARVLADTRSGAIPLVGVGVESFGTVHTDSRGGTVSLSGFGVEACVRDRSLMVLMLGRSGTGLRVPGWRN